MGHILLGESKIAFAAAMVPCPQIGSSDSGMNHRMLKSASEEEMGDTKTVIGWPKFFAIFCRLSVEGDFDRVLESVGSRTTTAGFPPNGFVVNTLKI